MSEVIDLLRKSGYLDKAIKYYIKKVNVGEVKNPSVRFAYTGPCGDTMEVFLRIHCACLAKKTLGKAIGQYRKNKN